LLPLADGVARTGGLRLVQYAWRAFLVAPIAVVLVVGRGFELAVGAGVIGANVALPFSLGRIAWDFQATRPGGLPDVSVHTPIDIDGYTRICALTGRISPCPSKLDRRRARAMARPSAGRPAA
jgi:hypothetical protein